MNYINHYATCRVCSKQDRCASLTKYGVRHYAHPACALEKWGESFFDRLALSPLQNFPALVAAKFGLFNELGKRIEAKRSVL